jgi:hypothetical protein
MGASIQWPCSAEHGSAPCLFSLPWREVTEAAALAFRRSTAALAMQINAMAQPRPCFLRPAQRRGLSAMRCPSPARHLAGRS